MAEVQLIKKEVEVPKEASEVLDLVVELVADIKAGKDAGAITGENIPGLMKAIDGFEKIADEVKHDAIYMGAAVAIGELVGVLIKKDEA